MRGSLAGALALLAAPLLGACAHEVTRLTRDCPAAPGGWCAPAAQVAAASWEYAQLSQNAYWQGALESDSYRDRLYVLAPEVKERFASADDARGYAFSVFDRFGTDADGVERLREVVLVFRGTEGPKDWWYGNLLGKQGERGLMTFRQLRAGMDAAGYRDVPITLAGHSLGGRVADRVLSAIAREPANPGGSDQADRVALYNFNTISGGDMLREGVGAGENVGEAAGLPTRIAISESGEIAGLLRLVEVDPNWDGYVIDCRPGLDLVGGHYMRHLADCLTWIAARRDERAAASVHANEIAMPAAERDRGD